VLDQFSETTVINGVTFPNLIQYPAGLSSINDLMQRNLCKKYCINGTAPQTTDTSVPRHKISTNPHDEREEIFQDIMRSLKKFYVEKPKKTNAYVAPMDLKILGSDAFNETQFGVIYNQKTAKLVPIFRLRTFLPRDLNGSIATIAQWINWSASNEADETVIDVSHNGGGIICLADFLLAAIARPWMFLNSNTSIPPAYGVYDFRHSPITDRIIKNRMPPLHYLSDPSLTLYFSPSIQPSTSHSF
jgi:hypothetical protein